MLKKIVLVFAALALAKAQIPSVGWCPELAPMGNFDMNKFLGTWYEAERYFQLSEVISRCVASNYTRGPDGKLRVSNEVTNRFTGVKRILDGEIKPAASKAEEGKLLVKYTTVPLTPETQYSVLETDYKNYAVLWSCSGIGPIHAQNAWVMTRKRLAPGEVLQRAYGVLDKYKISKTFFVKTDQAECAYEPPYQPEEPEVASAPAPAPVVEPAEKPVKEPIVAEPAAEQKSPEGAYLRSAGILSDAEPIDESPNEQPAAEVQADTPAKLDDPEAAEAVDTLRVAVPEEKPIAEEIKPVEHVQLKALAPERIPEVILKVAESAKEAAAPLAEKPELSVSPVAEESKTVEIAVPAESKPELEEAVLLPEATPEEPKTFEPAAELAKEQEAIQAAPIEEPTAAEPAKLPEEEPKIAEASEAAEELKPLEPLPALKSPEVAEIEKLEKSEKIESPVESVPLLKSAGAVAAEAEKAEIAEIPAAPESAPADSTLLKTLAASEAEEPKSAILESAEPSKLPEGGEQLLKKEASADLPESILEPVVPEAPLTAEQPLKSVEVAPEESKVEVDEVPKTLEAKP